MGKQIVRNQSGNNVAKQRRIWNVDDLNHILEIEEGKSEVDAIVTNLDGSTTEFKIEALSKMQKLKLLMIEYLSNEFPPSFQPRKLVHLKLWNSNIEQLWNNGIKLYHLKVIDLSFSRSFTKLEDFTIVPNLEALILNGCTKLSEIHPSIEHLKRLILLELEDCTSLDNLPEKINGLTSLQTLKLSGCCNLERLPYNLDHLKSLRNLEIKGSGIKQLPSSIFLMEKLETVSCDEKMIQSATRENIISYRTTGKCFFPRSFCNYLVMLDLIDCKLTGPEAFPEYFSKLVGLEYLYLSKNLFSVLPPGISGLYKLGCLKLEHCESLRYVEPELLPPSLKMVYVNYCTSLGSFLDPLRPCHLRCSSVFCLDCTELVRGQDGKMTALASLTRFLEDHFIRFYQDFKIVVPHQSDDELPSWFINHSKTASISIKLDPNWHYNCSSCGPWGVRLVYEEDIGKLKEITSRYINDQKDAQSSHAQSILTRNISTMCIACHGQSTAFGWTRSSSRGQLEVVGMQRYAVHTLGSSETTAGLQLNSWTNLEEVVRVSCVFNGRFKDTNGLLGLPLEYYSPICGIKGWNFVPKYIGIIGRPGYKFKGNGFVADATKFGYDKTNFGFQQELEKIIEGSNIHQTIQSDKNISKL
ncbi:hypothetical protein FNV43_RR08403 [Rhamnella rubrinervis]|uniref:Uncharacterized protein n=1 Tax=Rhamnella rubrinervis TaxID=2594499 RepID=A0A8K0H8J1_9ROSA|nr:hypothetical protein FNV43_RR08403 [Rhamnella rubrinervis]